MMLNDEIHANHLVDKEEHFIQVDACLLQMLK